MKLWFGRQEEMAFDGCVRLCVRVYMRVRMRANEGNSFTKYSVVGIQGM